MRWVPGKDGTLIAMAVGSINGKERREMVATLHPDGKEDLSQVTALAAINEGVEKALPEQSRIEKSELVNGHV